MCGVLLQLETKGLLRGGGKLYTLQGTLLDCHSWVAFIHAAAKPITGLLSYGLFIMMFTLGILASLPQISQSLSQHEQLFCVEASQNPLHEQVVYFSLFFWLQSKIKGSDQVTSAVLCSLLISQDFTTEGPKPLCRHR